MFLQPPQQMTDGLISVNPSGFPIYGSAPQHSSPPTGEPSIENRPSRGRGPTDSELDRVIRKRVLHSGLSPGILLIQSDD